MSLGCHQDVTKTTPGRQKKSSNYVIFQVLDAAHKIKLLADEDDEHAIILKEDNLKRIISKKFIF